MNFTDETITRGNKNFKRVNKTRFINWFNSTEDKDFILCSNKVSPYSNIFAFIENTKKLKEHWDFKDIKTFINFFEFHNCNYELGYYPKYYIEI